MSPRPWSDLEKQRLAELWESDDAAKTAQAAADVLNREFGTNRTAKKVKNKIEAMGLHRSDAYLAALRPRRAAAISAAVMARGALPSDTQPRAPDWPLPPGAFRDVPAAVLKREEATPGWFRPVRRPDPNYSIAGCSAELAAA